MNKTILIIFIFFTHFNCLIAQISHNNERFKTGRIEYEIYISGSTSIDTIKNNDEKQMLSRMKKIFDAKTFVLEFNNDMAVFKSIKALIIEDKDNDYILKMASILSRDSKIYYRNNTKKEKFVQINFSGEKLLVQEEFDNENWVITKETKIIQGYICRKAYKKISEYNTIKKETRQFFPVVWFCPEINRSFGPIGLDGLPGLVLEGTINNKFIYRAKTIDLNNPEINLDTPKGKRISIDEYKELMNN